MENGSRNEDSVIENEVCYKESARGGHDVWSCQNGYPGHPSSSSADHLVVMVNGILGSVNDWKFGEQQFVKSLSDKVNLANSSALVTFEELIFLHRPTITCSESSSERNVSMSTLDGVDVMGDRLAEEVLEVIKEKPSICKISFVAHSIGGLVARYAIGKLYQPSNGDKMDDSPANGSEESSKATIAGLKAMNFITVASPHLGSRGNKHASDSLSPLYRFCLEFLLLRKLQVLRTGKHLFLTDCDDDKPPLLKRLVQDDYEYPFMSALRTFRRRVTYSNILLVGGHLVYDVQVNYQSGRSPSMKNIHMLYMKSIPKQVKLKVVTIIQWKILIQTRLKVVQLYEELVIGLSRVSWEKVDVSFHTSRQRFAAHSVIQVKDSTVHAEGADVIQHMIDHFQL
ncbi:hypothetical protein V2J09_014487 [Rumex salicifolius]